MVRQLLFVFSIIVAPVVAASEEAEPVVLFNTLCASCHEGECSGRLTFDTGSAGATGHIRRHAGPVSDQMVSSLFEALVIMKQACAYPPFDVTVPNDHRWSANALKELGIPSGKGWFVPLGRLAAGNYHLSLVAGANVRLRLQVVRDNFESSAEDCTCTHTGETAYPFTVDKAGTYYLRITSREPLRLKSLALFRR